MLRILLGFRTGNRVDEDPTVLYCGHSASALEAAIGTAGPEHTRIERADIPETRRARRPLFPAAPAVLAPEPEKPEKPEKPEGGAADELELLTINDLGETAAEEDIDLAGLRLKAEIIARVKEFRALDAKTVEQLREDAAAMGENAPPLTAHMRKSEIINAMIKAKDEREPSL